LVVLAPSSSVPIFALGGNPQLFVSLQLMGAEKLSDAVDFDVAQTGA
jgi:hypothetical protein